MLIKGDFHCDRIPKMFVHYRKIDFVGEHKYLGVYVDKKLSFILYTQHLRNRINAILSLLKKTIQGEWGLNRKAYLLFYRCLYIPVITYGAVALYEKVSHSHVERGNELYTEKTVVIHDEGE